MIIGDIKRQLFDVLKGRILILCALDVDAICACKILQFLLQSFNLQHTVAPVASTDNLSKRFEEYRNSVDSIIMINFGNTFNIISTLKPAENITFYVIDSHRPINIYNFYHNPTVKVLINQQEPDLKIPSKHKIFLPDDPGHCEETSLEIEMALLEADPRTMTTEQLERRQQMRRWSAKKAQLMFNYEEFHFYNRSVSLIMYDLASFLSKGNNYLLWLAIVGLTYQLRSDKITRDMFEYEAEKIVRHISRNQVSSNHARGSKWKIEWQRDLQLDLYRKWNVYESFWHTPLTVCSFQLWNDYGQRDLHEFLVTCGLKLDQCRNEFAAMNLDFRHNMVDDVQSVCLGELRHKYGLEELITRTFVLSSGYRKTFCANDYVLAIRALLESHDPNRKMTEKFVRAVQSVSYDEFIAYERVELLEHAFEAAKGQLKSMFQQVKALITNRKVQDAGMFLHADLQEQATISRDFARGDSLISFARFLQSAYVTSRTTKVAKRVVRLPLFLFSPDYYNQDEILIVGVRPQGQATKRDFFAKAFEQIAAALNCEIKSDLSETNLVRTSSNNKNLILEQIKLSME